MGNVLPPSFHPIRDQQRHHSHEYQIMDVCVEDKETEVLLSSDKESVPDYLAYKKSTLLKNGAQKGALQKKAIRIHCLMSSMEKKTFMDTTIRDKNGNPLVFGTNTPNTIGLDKNTAAQLYQICALERILERTGFN